MEFEMPEVGKTYELFYNEGNCNNMIFHVRAIVDCEYFVYKWWSTNKQSWRYIIEWGYLFHSWKRDGLIIDKGWSECERKH